MKETPNAQQAFEDYYAMGADRSLRRLAEEQVRETFDETSSEGQTLEQAIAAKFRWISEWSTEHNWQERIKQRIEEDALAIRKRLRERAVKFRERVTGAIEVDVSRLLQRLAATDGEVLAKNAADIERLVKLYYQLAETPLSERHEIDANVKHDADPNIIEELSSRIAGIAARLGEADDTE